MPIDPSTAFVSYSREDLEFVLRLTRDLKAKGAKVWMDRVDIRAGQIWEQAIEDAVGECRQMLVVLSPAAVQSKRVMVEISTAFDENKEIIPVLFQECRIPRTLRLFQHADFRTSYDEGLEALLVSLAGEHETAAAVAVPAPEPPISENERRLRELERRAEGGDAAAMCLLGKVYEHGQYFDGEVFLNAPSDRARAMTWYRKAADTGDPTGLFNLGWHTKWDRELSDNDRRLREWERRAESGDTVSMCLLGKVYENGQFFDGEGLLNAPSDPWGLRERRALAMTWYRKAADAGDPTGMFNLACLYNVSADVNARPAEKEIAAEWYRKAAEAGFDGAIFSLARMYGFGEGVPLNLEEARKWYSKSNATGPCGLKRHSNAWTRN